MRQYILHTKVGNYRELSFSGTGQNLRLWRFSYKTQGPYQRLEPEQFFGCRGVDQVVSDQTILWKGVSSDRSYIRLLWSPPPLISSETGL